MVFYANAMSFARPKPGAATGSAGCSSRLCHLEPGPRQEAVAIATQAPGIFAAFSGDFAAISTHFMHLRRPSAATSSNS